MSGKSIRTSHYFYGLLGFYPRHGARNSLQNDVGNTYSPTTIIAPISRHSHTKANLPTHYAIAPVAGLAQPSVVLFEQIRVIDKGRLERRIGMLSEKSMRGIDNAIRVSVGLTAISQRIPLCLCHACAGKLIGTGVFNLRKPDYYQPDEMEEILAALENAPLKWKTITYLLIDTGCRRGEILGLKPGNVDYDTGLVVIDHALLSTKSK